MPDTPTLPEAKATAIAAAATQRDAVIAAGVRINDRVFASDATEQLRILQEMAKSEWQPHTFPTTWRLLNGHRISLTVDNLVELVAGLQQRIDACRTRFYAHEDAINTLTTPEACAAYDVTTGWPD